MVSVDVQPLTSVTVTIYCVLVAGLAVGLNAVVDESPLDGDQLTVFTASAVGLPPMLTLPPGHIAISGPASILGNPILICCTKVESHPFPEVAVSETK